MAVTSLCFPKIVPPTVRTKPTPNFSSCFFLPPLFTSPATSPPPRARRLAVTFASHGPKDAMASQDKRELFERYGLDPNDFLSETPPKRKKRKEAEKLVGRGKQVVEEDKKTTRTTHKLLQVLAGKAKRKKLLSPVGMDVRPMMEVVKGAAFDILQVAGGCPASLRPGCWLDLFSGTGSVGIEAISRGCSEVHFVEMDPWVVSNVLQPNLQWTGFLEVSVILTVCVENFLKHAEKFVGSELTFDYISVTPPYMEVDYGLLMGQISNSSIVGEDTLIIADRRFGRTHLAQKKRK